MSTLIRLLCLSIVLLQASCVDAPDNKGELKEILGVVEKDSFCVKLTFPGYPDHPFQLWIPELAIFDNDAERKMLHCIDGSWYEEHSGLITVMGSTAAGEKSLDFKCRLKPLSGNAIMLLLTVVNTGTEAWSDYAQMAICLAPWDGGLAFSDSSGAHTHVNRPGGRIMPLTDAGNVGGFNHYPVGERNDPQDKDQRSPLENGFVARTGMKGSATISFMWNRAARVDVNPGGLDCIHSHPSIGPLAPGDSAELTGCINIAPGDAVKGYEIIQELLDKYGK